MSELDWVIIVVYLGGMLGLSAWVGRGQRSRKDYYLGGNTMGPLMLATSTIATQCSTNSLLGAPAFVGFVAGGGMIWLQYELAVPLAMLALMLLLSPMRRLGYISAYGFLQDRLGTPARIVASTSFLVFRGIATGVTVYGVSLVLMLLIDVSYVQAVLILMGVTVVYDVIGGMRAVVISDVIQVVLIVAAVGASLLMLVSAVGGIEPLLSLAGGRTQAMNPSWGLQDGDSYGFWPMLIGGLFLYMAYYGCDQSQAQRVLAARSERDANRVLLLNGVLRFPLVLLYCLLGLALAAYASMERGFIASLPSTAAGGPNFNLVFPTYVLAHFSPGVIGLVMAGILAAAMSSVDSALNSLSATSVEDYLNRGGRLSERAAFIVSKLATVGWGLFAVAFSFQVEHIAPTVLEAINKIGSMVNGPLLALFLVAGFMPAAGARRAVAGFFAGAGSNLVLWLWYPQVSWLWWNVSGCVVALAVTLIGAGAALNWPAIRPSPRDVAWLAIMTGCILATCLLFQAVPWWLV
jgi:SSS family solute:Na+ symporter